jgi:hypothetical protein
MGSFTKEQRRAIARRVFAALCEHYPARYVALVEGPKNAEAMAEGRVVAVEPFNPSARPADDLRRPGAVDRVPGMPTVQTTTDL